jgi:hypothetical protein
MPTLVHLADEKNSKKIIQNGLKTGRYGTGVYCMPVLPNFYVSHQWLRELKRSGARSYVGVYFKAPSSEMVYAGKYGQKHRHITLGEAINEIMSLEDPLGYELIIDRKIEPGEITNVKHLPQTLGWRYFPGSHNKKPCNCEYCLRGNIKGKRTYNRLNKEEEGDDQ